MWHIINVIMWYRLELHGIQEGVAGNKKGEFEVEAQFLSKLHTNNAYILLILLLLKGTIKNEAQFIKTTVSYCPPPPVSAF
jgi:hypothetical protein